MIRLLVNAPSGAQELIEVGVGGGYFDPSRVLWDERDDGLLPEITLGGMVRAGNALLYSQERMDEHIEASRPPVPIEVEGWQAEVAMRATPSTTEGQSVWDRVQDLIAAMPDSIEKITAQTVLARGKIRRDSAMLAQLAPMVPLIEEQVDDLMRLAASIQA